MKTIICAGIVAGIGLGLLRSTAIDPSAATTGLLLSATAVLCLVLLVMLDTRHAIVEVVAHGRAHVGMPTRIEEIPAEMPVRSQDVRDEFVGHPVPHRGIDWRPPQGELVVPVRVSSGETKFVPPPAIRRLPTADERSLLATRLAAAHGIRLAHAPSQWPAPRGDAMSNTSRSPNAYDLPYLSANSVTHVRRAEYTVYDTYVDAEDLPC